MADCGRCAARGDTRVLPVCSWCSGGRLGYGVCGVWSCFDLSRFGFVATISTHCAIALHAPHHPRFEHFLPPHAPPKVRTVEHASKASRSPLTHAWMDARTSSHALARTPVRVVFVCQARPFPCTQTPQNFAPSSVPPSRRISLAAYHPLATCGDDCLQRCKIPSTIPTKDLLQTHRSLPTHLVTFTEAPPRLWRTA